ncbi:AAA family ATPase [Aporhodopirellula aestuarii]|uniref:AAA family ATPase n=1 Tax=Aporhodopirellula aestuarii TaxID=2950107 RepID=A0ABT0U888_9BACT|nr:AAA family ATPase [Aporhodopirellula aestuarii]MCM2372623.1 AAA family ATPase [Aporhodopirellula aestuarii]
MSDSEAALEALRVAMRLAPHSLDLAEHFGKTLMTMLRYGEAEQHFKDMLTRYPDSRSIKTLLADAYYRQDKNSHALAIVETLISGPSTYAPALILHSRLMYRAGEVSRAVSSYKQAIDLDDEVADEQLEGLLGIGSWSSDDESPFGGREDENEVVDGRIRLTSEGDDTGPSQGKVERPKIKFADVGGMTKVKEQIEVKIIHPLTHAEMYAAYGKKVGGGILMYGPPGCGKTHLARATAGEVDARYMSIGINDVLDMWIGNSERNLHSLFEEARRNRPCVLFFDEVDALGASRSDMRQSAGRHLVNQFLSELDGVESDNEGVLILGATNAPWHVDAAFRRPGRFDQVIFVPPPDQEARVEIVKLLIEGKPTLDVDCQAIAKKSREFSGADLQAVVDRAVETKLQEAVKTGKPTPLTTKDLLATLKTVKPSTKEWFATARNHAVYANQGGTYDDILEYLKIK